MQMSNQKLAEIFDVVVFGAGINGAAITAEIAARGLRVLNVEIGNIGGGTSSHSTCLIHGGLRYLEQHAFGLVRKSLVERQSLLELAPHLVRPLPFVLPRTKDFPFWLARLGLLIYDNLSFKNKLAKSQCIKRSVDSKYFELLASAYNEGLLYYDCTTDDTRLTITKALQARELGAIFLHHTKLKRAHTQDGSWHLDLESQQFGRRQIKTRAIINATGAAVKTFAEENLKVLFKNTISLVKGSHIILPKLYAGNHAYILQNTDKRVIFITPFHDHTMIGTTDIYVDDNLAEIAISAAELDYLIAATKNYLKIVIDKTDIVSTRSGLRVLQASPGVNASSLSRDYALDFSVTPAPVLHVIGGKLTIHSQLSEQAVDKLMQIFPGLPKTKRLSISLPGASLTINNSKLNFFEYVDYAKKKYHWLDNALLNRYLQSYGTRTEKILASCKKVADLGVNFASNYYQVEIDYLLREEFASDLDSLLWLHTKLGLIITLEGKQKLSDYLHKGL